MRMFRHYLGIIEASPSDPLAGNPYLSLENLAWMCREGMREEDTLPIDKLSRWLGCVQGCLAMRGLIAFDAERDLSRPLFHAGYREDGIPVPGRHARPDR